MSSAQPVAAESHAASTAHVAHHFDTREQQFDAARLGMWLFLATEVLFFGGMFAGYTVYRLLYGEAFAAGSRQLNVTLGAFNTTVLLLSSLMMAMAVHAAQTSSRRLVTYIAATGVLGAVFLGVKYFEYEHKFHEHLVPGLSFGTGHYENALEPNSELFFSFYFAMTGMHALHMIIGLGLMVWLVVKARAGAFSPEFYTPVEMVGLYWHFVDIVWVYLFPMLYLIG